MVCAWGNNEYNQLGIQNVMDDEDDDSSVLLPREIDFFNGCSSYNVIKIACGWHHTLFLFENGLVYSCGLNENGQLGRSQSSSTKLERIEALEAMKVTHVSCGESHSIVLNDHGQIYGFGNNSYGQLGLGITDLSKSIPKQIKFPTSKVFITQVACGKEHTLALSSVGQIFCWGRNTHGQLGLGNKSERVITPKLITSLVDCPIYKICAGSYHSVAITYSGTTFTWGMNQSGQLGTGDTAEKLLPTNVRLLSGKGVLHVACGEEHTVALTMLGGVFTFGCGMSGQLGHNAFNNEYNPKMVLDLMGCNISQIACGRKHTLAFVCATGKLYAFGLGVKGQLGINSLKKHLSPMLLSSLWGCQSKPILDTNKTNFKENYYFENDYESMINECYLTVGQDDISKNKYFIREIFGGSLQSFAILKPSNSSSILVFHAMLHRNSMLYLNENIIHTYIDSYKVAKDKPARVRILESIAATFSNRSCLNASFLKRQDHFKVSAISHGLQLFSMRSNLKILCEIDEIKETILKSLENYLIPSLKFQSHNIEGLRVFLLIPELPFYDDASHIWKLLLPLANCIIDLPMESKIVLEKWWSSLPSTFFTRIIKCYTKAVVTILDQKLPETANQVIFALHAALRTCMAILERLFQMNKTCEHPVLFNTFYIQGIMNKIDMKADYLNWIQNPNIFSFCQYPFVLDGKIKSSLMKIDAELQMKAMVSEAYMYNFTNMMQGNMSAVNPFLVMNIRRDHIVQDTLNEISSQSTFDLKKPLKIKFSNEDAEDAGGVKKEFFLLLMKEILDPKYGMFNIYSESRLLWFNGRSFESVEMFRLIGMICGLAIYNSTIIDLPFPSCLYKKLLREDENLDDLRELQPDVAKNLQSLLDYQGDDFIEVFDLNFQVNESYFGELTNIDLKADGEHIHVTQDNKEEYVMLYVKYKLCISVENQFNSFAEGFHHVCGGKVLNFFHPQELMEMIVGSQDYDFADLEKVAEYKGEYYRNHPVIINFWNVFYEFTLDYKKKFLAFLTGSDKVSILGMKHMKFIVQPVAGGPHGEHLPVAHTCFNLLDLPRYPTIQVMRYKLCQAIENSQGFGLV